MSESVEVEYLLTVNAEPTYAELRKVEMMLMRIMHYLRRLTGSEQIDQAIMYIERLIMTIRSLQMAMHALEIASGPIGWVYAGVTAIGAGFSVYDMLRG